MSELESEFRDKVSAACSKELAGAKGDPERMGAAVEALSAALGFTIAIAAKGNSEAISTLLEGAIAYVTEETARRAPLAGFIARQINAKRGSS